MSDGKSRTTAGQAAILNKQERSTLAAIAYRMDEPGSMVEWAEALVPDLIARGLVTQHTVWRLTKAGMRAIEGQTNDE